MGKFVYIKMIEYFKNIFTFVQKVQKYDFLKKLFIFKYIVKCINIIKYLHNCI